MQTLNNLEKTSSEKLSDYMDTCTVKEYLTVSNILKNQLGWSRTTLSNKRTGRSALTPAEIIAIPILLNRNIF